MNDIRDVFIIFSRHNLLTERHYICRKCFLVINYMSSNSRQEKKDYYIIRGVDISKTQSDLEQHMIDHFFYEKLDWDQLEHRVALKERINSFKQKSGKLFCGEGDFGLTSHIGNTENTIIYSMEKKRLDCVLLFNEKMDENNDPYIYIEYFCANQIFPTKKGGLFFEHFLDSLRGQYKKIILSPSSNEDTFFKSFYFNDIEGIYEDEDYVDMVRLLSPISDKNRRRKPLNYLSEDEDVADSDSIEFRMTSLRNYKFTPHIKKDYYIIPSSKKYKKPKLERLEKYMIAKRNYKIHESYDRISLINKITTYFSFFTGGFCYSYATKQGGIDTDHLLRHIVDDNSTVIYSIENDEIDCVIVFYDKNRGKYIKVEAFCSNQTINTKKGGIFFGYFLNSLRGKYKNVMLQSAADNFYKSFYFSENNNRTMIRTISPKSKKNRTRKQYNPHTIPGDVNIIYIPSRVKSARKNRIRKNKTLRKTLSI